MPVTRVACHRLQTQPLWLTRDVDKWRANNEGADDADAFEYACGEKRALHCQPILLRTRLNAMINETEILFDNMRGWVFGH
jgi:hypothetical protein